MKPIKLIIDTDPGVDDAMAILYAAAHPGLELIGLTTVFGNVPVATATRNALFLTEMSGLDIPVAEGAAAPLVQPLPPHPDFVHGVEGFGNLPPCAPKGRADPRPAARFLCERTAAHPGQVTICAIGPLTNLAAALELAPSIAHNVGRVVVMGGAVGCPGNVNAHAEANICLPADFAGLARAAPVIGGFLERAVQFYFDFHRSRHNLDGCHMHDPTAVIEITDPGVFKVRESPVAVMLEGEAAGRTRLGPAGSGPTVRVCIGVDAEAVRARFLAVTGKADACRGGSPR